MISLGTYKVQHDDDRRVRKHSGVWRKAAQQLFFRSDQEMAAPRRSCVTDWTKADTSHNAHRHHSVEYCDSSDRESRLGYVFLVSMLSEKHIYFAQLYLREENVPVRRRGDVNCDSSTTRKSKHTRSKSPSSRSLGDVHTVVLEQNYNWRSKLPRRRLDATAMTSASSRMR